MEYAGCHYRRRQAMRGRFGNYAAWAQHARPLSRTAPLDSPCRQGLQKLDRRKINDNEKSNSNSSMQGASKPALDLPTQNCNGQRDQRRHRKYCAGEVPRWTVIDSMNPAVRYSSGEDLNTSSSALKVKKSSRDESGPIAAANLIGPRMSQICSLAVASGCTRSGEYANSDRS